MDSFIKRYQFNNLNKLMKDLRDAYVFCADIDIINVTKSLIKEKIYYMFSELDPKQAEKLNIDFIKGKLDTYEYISKLEPYVYGMPEITAGEIKKLFKKEKKLKIPDLDNMDFSSLTYIGWRDKRTESLYIVYNLDGELVGAKCRTLNPEKSRGGVCTICNCAGRASDMAFVSIVKKKSFNYNSIGFTICLDSEKCNNNLTSVDKLEEILRKVI